MACTGCKSCRQDVCFGASCNETCNPNCRAVSCSTCSCEVCNQVTGNCTNGCHSGWYGGKCEHVCPDKCELTKKLTKICDRDSGDCLNECQVGFYGDKCNNTCYTGCVELLCQKQNGTCVNGCVGGYVGEFCGDHTKNGLGGDAVAGAIGGAFVITLWAAVVIVLICFIWRRRLKDYEVFNRNTIFGNESDRTTSGRHIDSSRSSLNGSTSHSIVEELLNDVENSGAEACNKHLPLHEKRAAAFDTETPKHCTCSHSGSGDSCVCGGGTCMMEQDEYEHTLQNHVHEYHVHFNGHETAYLSMRRSASDGDINGVAHL